MKSGLYAYHDHLQATNKFYLAAIVLSDPVLHTVRRELQWLSDVRVEVEELREALKQEVIKRDVIEGDKADGARKKVAKAAGKMLSRQAQPTLRSAGWFIGGASAFPTPP